MPTPQALQADLAELVRLARVDLAALFAEIDDVAATRALLADVLPDLADVYGSAAASIAADWYDDVRDEEEISGRFRALAAALPDRGRTDALAAWAASTATDIISAQTLAQGGLQRIIANAGRDTVTGSSIADPRARGWQRAGSGHNCAFCNMLIGRGAVYSERSVSFAAHDHCNCVAVPAWEDRPAPVKPYTPSQRDIPASERERLRAYLAAHPELWS